MNKNWKMKSLLVIPVAVLVLGVGGGGLAAAQNASGAMSGQTQNSQSRMSQMMRGGMGDAGMMNGNRQSGDMPANDNMMGGGMMSNGMMGSCPMMGAGSGANSKVMMQMHGEMMRAMGDIMIKYADKLDAPASSN